MRCDITEDDVETVYLIQIRGRKLNNVSGIEDLDWDTLVYMESISNEIPTLSSDIVASVKDFVAGGEWNSTSPSSTYLTLIMNMTKIECTDSRDYKCELAYKSNITEAVKNHEMNNTFTVYGKFLIYSVLFYIIGNTRYE